VIAAKPKKLTPTESISLDFVEGMARIRGLDAFSFMGNAEVCWHCEGRRFCNCASCIEFTDRLVKGTWQTKPTKCGCCHGAGLLTWLEVA